MQIRNLFNNEDRAVSPVIGVILMVAITVILAAVIGTFVLGLGDNIQQNVQAGATINVDEKTDKVTVTFNSRQSETTQLRLTTSGAEGSFTGSEAFADGSKLSTIGQSTVLSPAGDAGKQGTITITVTAVDGDAETVVVQKTVTVNKNP